MRRKFVFPFIIIFVVLLSVATLKLDDKLGKNVDLSGHHEAKVKEDKPKTIPTDARGRLFSRIIYIEDQLHGKKRIDRLDYSFQKKSREVYQDPDIIEWQKNEPSDNSKLVRPPRSIQSIPKHFNLENGTFHEQNCTTIEEWQLQSFPTCNSVHELGFPTLNSNIKYIARGSIRTVWKVKTNFIEMSSSKGSNKKKSQRKFRKKEESTILKVLYFDGRFDPQQFDSHRRDAVATERLTSSKYVADIYSFCGQTSLNEAMYSDLGAISQRIPPIAKLTLALQAIRAIKDVHAVGHIKPNKNLHDGHHSSPYIPTIVHRDITHRNFLVNKDGFIKLNDFNVCKFPQWDERTQTSCGFFKPDAGPYRAPEEFRKDVVNEKADIYAFGNVLYYLLTHYEPYHYPKHLPIDQIKIRSIGGETPYISGKYRHSDDPIVQKIIELMQKCWKYEPSERPSAKELEKEIRSFIAVHT